MHTPDFANGFSTSRVPSHFFTKNNTKNINTQRLLVTSIITILHSVGGTVN